jgi:hypothetical protein
MGTEPELRQELAEERLELKEAVADLRGELGTVAERGKRLGIRVGAATGAAIAAKLLLKLKRRRSD